MFEHIPHDGGGEQAVATATTTAAGRAECRLILGTLAALGNCLSVGRLVAHREGTSKIIMNYVLGWKETCCRYKLQGWKLPRGGVA